MNLYAQILSITLGGLLSISEILPFIKNVKTNGILHFFLSSLIKDTDEYQISIIDPEISDLNRNCNNNEDHQVQTNRQHYLTNDLESQPLLGNNITKYTDNTVPVYVQTGINPDLNDKIKNDLDIILKELYQLKHDKENNNSSKNVEDIVEMIFQHLRDLQRAQSQWVDNYGENNLKNDIKFENIINKIGNIKEIIHENTDNIIEHIRKLKELMYETVETVDEANNINTNIISKELIHQTIHEFFENKHVITSSNSGLDTDKFMVDMNISINDIIKQHLELQIAEMNNNFTKQSLLIDGLTSQCANLGNKLNDLTLKLNNSEKIDKRKKKTNFLIGGKDL